MAAKLAICGTIAFQIQQRKRNHPYNELRHDRAPFEQLTVDAGLAVRPQIPTLRAVPLFITGNKRTFRFSRAATEK